MSGTVISGGGPMGPDNSVDVNGENQEGPQEGTPGHFRFESSSVTAAPCCATWSGNSELPEWRVKLLLSSAMPENLNERLQFVAAGNCFVRSQPPADSAPEVIPDAVKIYARYKQLTAHVLKSLTVQGAHFTRLDLTGFFFVEATLCPPDISNSKKIPRITIPNLKALSVRPKLTLPLKGLQEDTQRKYLKIHEEHCSKAWKRTAENLWFIFNAFDCPQLESLEITDSLDWSSSELMNSGFYYWSKPLLRFLRRHSGTLYNFKASPLVVMQHTMEGAISNIETLPAVRDLFFAPALYPLETETLRPNLRRSSSELINEIEGMLSPWRAFLDRQRSLKSLVWVSDIMCPWPYVKYDFVKLCHQNPNMECLFIAAHGDEFFRRKYDVPLINEALLYELDAGWLRGMTSLRVLSLGSYGSDPQRSSFGFTNFHHLPRTLEVLQLFGMKASSEDLGRLTDIPNLKVLSIIESERTFYSSSDEANNDCQGVTPRVLKSLLARARSLEKLTIVGFPAYISDEERRLLAQTGESGGACFGFGSFCSSLLCSEALESQFQNAVLEQVFNDEEENGNGARMLSSLKFYSVPMRRILEHIHTHAIGTVSEISDNEGQPITVLRIGAQ